VNKLARLLALLIFPLATVASGQSTFMTTGDAAQAGAISFTLVADDGSTLPVTAAISAGMTANSKAALVASAASGGNWLGYSSDNWVWFYHLEVGTWRVVNQVDALIDTSGGPMGLWLWDAPQFVDLEIASTFSVAGGGSLSLQVVDTPYVMSLSTGMSASQIMNNLETYLLTAGPGVSVMRLAPNKLRIMQFYRPYNFAVVQTTNTGLQSAMTMGCGVIWTNSGLIDR
jgi:hypothetical protein